MSVVLYKPGNSHTIRGIRCDFLVCDEYSYLHLLEQGYFYSPEECYAKSDEEVVGKEETEESSQEESSKDETEDETQEDAEPVLAEPTGLTSEEAQAAQDEIRATAKEAGIKHWHNKKIVRLISELKELEDAE